MPLLNSVFPLGQCTRYIEKMEDEDERNIAWAEYYYFSGQAEKAAEAVELYLCTSTVRMMHYGIRQRGSMPFPTLLVTRLP